MDQYSEQLQALTDIRSMMEKSTKFVSLSGFTGISIGIVALICALISYISTGTKPFSTRSFHEVLLLRDSVLGLSPTIFIIALALFAILGSLIIGFYYTQKRAAQSNVVLWSRSFKLMLLNIAIPLVTGGVFCIFLSSHGVHELIAPAMLIFYGLALINGGKYTLQDVNSLGLMEIALGIVALIVNGYGLEFWTIGFGIFHIIYGARLYFKQK